MPVRQRAAAAKISAAAMAVQAVKHVMKTSDIKIVDNKIG